MTADLDELLRPPTDREVEQTLAAFGRLVRAHYGDRVKGLYLFGSRARGDHRPHSDADVAVILEDGPWRFWDEKMQLVDLAFNIGLEHRMYVQPWPFAECEWSKPIESCQSNLVLSARRDARALP